MNLLKLGNKFCLLTNFMFDVHKFRLSLQLNQRDAKHQTEQFDEVTSPFVSSNHTHIYFKASHSVAGREINIFVIKLNTWYVDLK